MKNTDHVANRGYCVTEIFIGVDFKIEDNNENWETDGTFIFLECEDKIKKYLQKTKHIRWKENI